MNRRTLLFVSLVPIGSSLSSLRRTFRACIYRWAKTNWFALLHERSRDEVYRYGYYLESSSNQNLSSTVVHRSGWLL